MIFGTGPVGRATARSLLRRGQEVRLVNRRGVAGIPRERPEDAWDDTDVVTGDAADAPFAAKAARGATAVYQTLNPSYHRWAEDFPPLQRAVLAAAEENQARFVNMDNVYSYGRPAGAALTEHSPERPSSRKGEIRLRMAEEVWAAHAAGRVDAVSGRASDYYGPGGGAASPLGDRVLKAAVTGTRAALFGDPDLPHSYTYIPDIGEGLAVLGTTAGISGRAWHLPNDPEPWTSRAMALELFRLAGTTPRIGRLPLGMLRVVGLFNPTVRELIEMAYEFDEPFVVDSTDIADLGVAATPIATALAETMEAYRAADAAPGSPGPGASDRG